MFFTLEIKLEGFTYIKIIGNKVYTTSTIEISVKQNSSDKANVSWSSVMT